MKTEHNIERLRHLISLYRIPLEDFLKRISEGLRNPIREEELFSNEIKISYLKRIDKIFQKGLHYYLDPKAPETSKEASIFFRKDKFNSELNIGATKIVNKFEEFKISLSAIAKLSDLEINRKLPLNTIEDDPKAVAVEIRRFLYPAFKNDLKSFLIELITRFAKYNLLVLEFVEYWNQKEKANIDGFFLKPNVIVLKRQQTSFRREIFTLAHELGHFLLDEEEIESLDYQYLARKDISAIERWCNDFAYYFLVGEYETVIDSLETAQSSNDYHHEIIEDISKRTHLSKIALFTRLLYQEKISNDTYQIIRADFDTKFRESQVELEQQKQIEKESGIKKRGSAPQPIKSPMLVSTIQTAYYEGVLNEFEVCKRLGIKPNKLDKYIQ